MRSDRSTPNIVLAPSPKDRNDVIRLYANPFTIRQLIDDNFNAKVGEYCGLVHGNFIEDRGEYSGDHGTNGLMDSFAVFRGIKRPKVRLGEDEKVLVYVTNPECSFTYENRNRFSATGPSRSPKPKDAVFVTYVELFEDGLDRARFDGLNVDVDGVVHYWEWVLCSKVDRRLPDFWNSRYTSDCWNVGKI